MSSVKVAVVTGSNKGIGFAIVKQLCEQLKSEGIVYLTARDEVRGQTAVKELEELGLSPKFHALDIDNLDSIAKFRIYLENTHGGIDILVNNAAIAFDVTRQNYEPEKFGYEAKETILVNYFGTLNICRELFPLLRKGARVVNVSSCVGHLSEIKGQEPQAVALRAQFSDPALKVEELNQLMNSFVKAANDRNHIAAGWPPCSYTVSKIGLSALTRIQQKEFDASRPEDDIVVNSVHPGWVATDLSGQTGHLTIEEGAVAPVWCALLPPGVKSPRGGYVWRDTQVIDWEGVLPEPY